jgi:predicted esterase
MRSRFKPLFVLLVSTAIAAPLAGCAADAEIVSGEAPPAATVAEAPGESPPGTPQAGNPQTAAPPKPADDPGPAPAGCTGITKDGAGFFKRQTAKSDYVAYVPKGYSGSPTTLVVGMHGCGDSAYNFATWAVNPAKTRQTQTHIGISIGGKDGKCWDTSADVEKVTAAIADISTCFYVHQQKVVLAGYSSGGILAYRMGLTNADKYAGILVENSGLGGASPSAATWKINVAHTANDGDTAFPLAKVKADWAKLEAAGIPLQKRNVPGTHDGTSDDWSDWLLPKIAGWKAP